MHFLCTLKPICYNFAQLPCGADFMFILLFDRAKLSGEEGAMWFGVDILQQTPNTLWGSVFCNQPTLNRIYESKVAPRRGGGKLRAHQSVCAKHRP